MIIMYWSSKPNVAIPTVAQLAEHWTSKPKVACKNFRLPGVDILREASPTYTYQLLFQVSRDGKYSRLKRDSEKLTYISMVQTRAYIVFHSAKQLSKACTISIRYSAVRKQGKLDERCVNVFIASFTLSLWEHRYLLLQSFRFLSLDVHQRSQ